jgi:hypothetical protein
MQGYNKIVDAHSFLVRFKKRFVKLVLTIHWHYQITDLTKILYQDPFILSVSLPLTLFKKCLTLSLQERFHKLLNCCFDYIRYSFIQLFHCLVHRRRFLETLFHFSENVSHDYILVIDLYTEFSILSAN